MEWLTDPQAWIALGTLTALEVVLGIDNLVFISICLLYTSDAADERSSVDLGGRRIIKKKKQVKSHSLRIV